MGQAPLDGTSAADTYDAVLIGGGVMSATLATLLHQVEPTWRIAVVERMDRVSRESSGPWNNAGTGHAALCELNYSPENPDGSVDVSKAITVNEQFQVSRQLWAFLVESGQIPHPESFIHPTPHISFVWGEANVAYLKKRYDLLADHPLFAGLEYTEDPAVIAEWSPLLVEGRAEAGPVAATRSVAGTDVDFGSLAKAMFEPLTDTGAADMFLETEIRSVKKLSGRNGKIWHLEGKNLSTKERFFVQAPFVFVGAGGQALTLLQKSGIKEIRGFGGFPVSGEFWRSTAPDVVKQHDAKVYGRASVGAPPMSVPHLDTRVVDGEQAVMFGPYAGFSVRFLKHGSLWDLQRSVKWHNAWPMLQAGLRNLGLVKYLIVELLASRKKQLRALQEFVPAAEMKDWEKITAGQRVQVIKKVPGQGGVLQFGTEVITAKDGSIAGLLGASPGASTAAPIMLEILEDCFPERIEMWRPALEKVIPSYGQLLSDDPEFATEIDVSTARTLGLQPSVPTHSELG